ncbi:MAG: hypothetical protein WDO12_13345 [Pseudomonadota bacterium]
MIFLNDSKAKLDQDRFIKKHLPLLRRVYGSSVERIELRTAQASSPGMPPSPILATSYVVIKDVQGFSQALAANSKEINDDLDATAKGTRISQVDRLVASVGDSMADVKAGTQVLTTLYPAQPDKTLDRNYFVATHVPKLFSIYGGSALRRVEGTLGVDQGPSKAAYLATTHLYIRDRNAYDNAQRQGMSDMIEDAKKYTTIFPLFGELRVQAVG